MARAVLVVGAIAWGAAGVVGIALAAQPDLVARRLPELALDDAALGRTILALGAACLVVAVAHATVLLGLGRGSTWAASAGVLLGTLMAIGFLAAGAAALTSAAAATLDIAVAVAAAAAAIGLAFAYGLAAARLVDRLRGSGSGS